MPFLDRRTTPTDLDTNTRVSRAISRESAGSWTGDEYVPGPASRDAVRHLPRTGSAKQACGNPECSGGWTMPWKNRRRPIFEGKWGCSTRCLEAVVRKALRREHGDLRIALNEDAPHRHRVPLGLVMLSEGWITQAQLRRALEAQRSAGTGRIGDWLVQECGIAPAQVTRGLAVQWSCPVLPIDGFVPSAMALTIPRLFVETMGLLPLRVAASRILYLAFSDRLDASAAFAIEQMIGLRVESGLLDDIQFQTAQGRLLESKFVAADAESYADIDRLATRVTAVLEEKQPIGSRLVRLHQHYWLRTWLEAGAYSGVGTLPSSGEDVDDITFSFAARA